MTTPQRPARPSLNATALGPILARGQTIAVVGLSPEPGRPSHEVARYLRDAGFRIVPVNPRHPVILGEQSYPSLTLAAREHDLDVIDVFRRSEFAGAVVDEALTLKPLPNLIWLQVGVLDAAACERAYQAGVPCVMDRCLMSAHRRLDFRA
ncbi:MAG TPA: CoA-binding protein [Gemmatimonadales bacterium]|nr:CoA-binding protein [Gemmatimonadales bacterium]